ncbi:unnamed protein product, partial [Polarella glacialis]
AKLLNLLRLGVAAAAGRSPLEVAVTVTKLASMSAEVANLTASTALLSFDLDFGLCASNGSSEPLSLEAGDFEFAFKVEVQNYAAFRLAAMGLISFDPILSGSDQADNASQAEGYAFLLPGGSVAAAPSQNSGGDSTGAVIGFALGAAALMLAVGGGVGAWAWHRRRRKVEAEEDVVASRPSAEGGDTLEQVVLAKVACSFSPLDVEDDKVFRESCLELQEGDIVEVVAGGGGWFYGRILSSGTDSEGRGPVRVGYFPENRVSWVGQIPVGNSSSQVTSPEQHLLVSVEHGFSPRDVEDGEALRENCLQLAAGEVVEVLAGGGGWLYGQVAGDPERTGYFPENRASWLGRCETGVEATRTEQGMLVQVTQSFSPGSPGDAEEEVSFSGSCIALAEGDVVEVAAAGGGWLYGRVVGAPERNGYFPETRVSWVGRPVAASSSEDAQTLQAVQEQSVLTVDGIWEGEEASPREAQADEPRTLRESAAGSQVFSMPRCPMLDAAVSRMPTYYWLPLLLLSRIRSAVQFPRKS